MNTLLQIGLSNALSATALAVVAFAVSRFFHRPPLTQALWLIVLLKLLTPPLWSIPLWHGAMGDQQIAKANSSIERSDFSNDETVDLDTVTDPQPSASTETAARVEKSSFRDELLRWPRDLLIIWLTGSCLYAAAILLGTWRLRRLVRISEPVPESIQRRVDALAHAMQMRRVPRVRFLRRPLPPMLCAVGTSAQILLPLALWRKLDERQQDSVLVHELAHLRRRDHWLRVLELLVGALYWWHPVVWWARRELREASEQCCDAWVVWTMPRLAKRYAAALIETIDYISSAPTGVPALATGFGQFTNLRRRLVMIKQGNMVRSLTRPALAAVFGAAGLVLPLSPSLGQEVAPPAPEVPVIIASPKPDGPAIALAPTAPVAIEVAPAAKALPQDEDDSDPRAQSNKDRAQLEKARAEVQMLRAQLRAAERRLADVQRTNRRSEVRPNVNRSETPRPRNADIGYKVLPSTPASPVPAKAFSRSDDEAFAQAGERLRAAGQQLNDARDRARQTVERRLDQMERQLTTMVDQLRQMKRQLSDQSGFEPSRK